MHRQMTLPTAYSLDLQKVINPKDADIAYQAGKIASQKDFACPLCGIAVTCVNLSKPKNERKIEPYFRSAENHNCKLGKQEKYAKIAQSRATNESYYQDVPTGTTILNIAEPTPKQQHDDDLGCSNDEPLNKQRTRRNHNDSQRQINHTQRLSVVVSAFLKDENYPLTLPMPFQESKPIKEFFIKIAGQDLSELEDNCWRIYYGDAWINEMGGGDFLIRFVDTLRDKDLICPTKNPINAVRPTIFISKELIENTALVKFSMENMKRLVGKKPHKIFIMAHKPALNHSKQYINFVLEGLMFLEILDWWLKFMSWTY